MKCVRAPRLSEEEQRQVKEALRKQGQENAARLGLEHDPDLSFMLEGGPLQKVKSARWQKERVYRLQEDLRTIHYNSHKFIKFRRTSHFTIDDIQAVRTGHQSEGMKKFVNDVSEQRCFTIVFKSRAKNLDLIASSENEALHWIRGLQKIISRDSKMSKKDRLEQWFQIYLQKADVNKDNRMDENEVKNFMKMMNIDVDDAYTTQLFESCDKRKNGVLEGSEVEVFYRLVTARDEIDTIFGAFQNEEKVMTVDKLVTFMKKEQVERVSPEYAELLIQKYELNEAAKAENLLTKDGFLMYLMSSEGDIFNQEHKNIYQNMTKPLNHYFISSSHNTYLMEDQLEGPSSTEAYIRALNKGCRCVELDCWDGKNGEPVIYHGYTLTSKILFKDVIETIKEYAFKVSSYPVILSLENHCSIEQQTVMAKHLKTILGDMLLTAPIDNKLPTDFPSPEQLKGKILVKGKKLNRLEEMMESEDVNDEVSDEDEAAEMENGTVEKESKNHKLKLSKELSDIVIYCRSVHFNDFEHSKAHQLFYEMSSFAEGKFSKLIQESDNPFIHLNTRQLSRIYPGGLRTDSSNYSPIEMWSAGCQIVALNFQTPGVEMDINQGRFHQNGFSGYNLKPRFLRDKSTTFESKNMKHGDWWTPKELHVMIISAQQLPKENKTSNSIIDPLVTVEVFGVDQDNDKRVTDHIPNNGFKPMWNANFKFNVNVPELALIRFLVEDYDVSSRNDFIGQFTLPFTSLKLGYRHIHLLSKEGNQLPSASLFVHVMVLDK